MKILVLGSGGREHAIISRLARDSARHVLHAAPGNPGMAEHASLHDVQVMDRAAVVALATELGIDLVVVGPEAPLVAGIADALRDAGIAVFGPSRAAAQLEGSKDFAKQVMIEAGVPTARFVTLTKVEDIEAGLETVNPQGRTPYVVKDDGLAAGKGVVVTASKDAAIEHARACLDKEHGRVVIEEFLDGPELSVLCVCDGRSVMPLVPAQDFKRAYAGDEGPNTGGMGAYTPLPWLDERAAMDAVVRTVAQPTIDLMAHRGTPFVGTLFVGLAATGDGLKVIEFNARFGDPETQVVLERLEGELGDLLYAAATGALDTLAAPSFNQDALVAVVLASEGYPTTSRTGDLIEGLDAATDPSAYDAPAPHVIHAGTAVTSANDGTSQLVSHGGRVVCVVARAGTLEQARIKAQSAIARIVLPGSHYRPDIAKNAAAGTLTKVTI